jgi:hypothetical protein
MGQLPMRDFVDTLPLRLAAVVAALVGAICLWNGVELWESARRIGIAFVVLLLAALLVRRLVLAFSEGGDTGDDGETGGPPAAAPGPPAATALGRNTDVIVPGTPIGDLLREEKRPDE